MTVHKIVVTNARGESYPAVLRRTGQFGVLPTDTDAQAVAKINADAAGSAATAEAAAGPTYASKAAGVAATPIGQGFAVSNGDGTVTVYLKDGAANPAQRTLATTAFFAQPTGASGIGVDNRADYDGRSIGAVANSVVNVRLFPFLARGDGITDDAAAIRAAAEYAASVNKALYFPTPPAVYLCKSNIVITSSGANRLKWFGDGHRNSVLYWPSDATSRGVHLTYDDIYRPAEVCNLGFQTAATDGTGLWITGPDVLSAAVLGPSVEGCEFIGADVTAHGWETALHFETCWYITARRISIKGKDGSTNFDTKVGIKLTSCQVAWIRDLTIVHAETGILEASTGAISHGEGFSFQDFEIVGGLDGINLTADGTAPGTNIGPGHINTNRYGIKLANQWQTIVSGMLIYKTQVSTSNFVGMELRDCNAMRVVGNEVRGDTTTSTGDTLGMMLTGTTVSDECVISNNTFQNFGGGSRIAILVGTGASNCNIHDNAADGSVQACVIVSADADKNNRFHHNYPVGVQPLAANVATPSVGNDMCGLWKTSNTAPTMFNDFADGHSTQMIHIIVNDNNTTFQHNANLILVGGLNYTPPSGTILRFVRDGSIWREVGAR